MITPLQFHLATVFLKIFLRDRQSIVFTLLFPLIFTGVFLFSDGEPDPIKLGLVNQSQSTLAANFAIWCEEHRGMGWLGWCQEMYEGHRAVFPG